ncbi:hypothetical protein SDC9_65949 [bioreactor metagenome]|uniref:Peptidase C1A papain C-terminal domain-containing protein n=1 Tax=bioreactor metagenome TaxID=1076179 RepID=A0A644XZ11_9ZZZZ
MKHTYNLRREKKDERDYKLSVIEAAQIPGKVDLRDKCPPVFNQGALGSCTANAGVAAYMMLKGIGCELSRLFLYYEERRLEGTTGQDAGAEMRSIGKALSKSGVCLELLWPYIEVNYVDDPSDIADADAAFRKITAYRKLSGIAAIRQYIAKTGRPVMIGMEVYESFEADDVERTGVVPLPDTGKEELLGGHAVLVVGYNDDFGKRAKFGGFLSDLFRKFTGLNNDDDGYFIVRNSWGADWGDGGYFYLPYAFVRKYAFDFWVLE